MTEEQKWWSKITDHVEEKRIAWACGVVGVVLAEGESKSMKAARRGIACVKRQFGFDTEER